MKLGPLITGTLLAICFYVGSFFWVGTNQVPPVNQQDVDHGAVQRHDLLVTFRGPKPVMGQLMIQLFADENSFNRREQPFDECFLKLDLSDTVLWEFRNLPEGIYSVVAIHDRNENGKFDSQGSLGPERIGFSVQQLPSPAQPSFEDCRFELTGRRAIEIELR